MRKIEVDLVKLAALYNANVPYIEMAQTLNCSIKVVTNRVKTLKKKGAIVDRYLTKGKLIRENNVVDSYNKGLSVNNIISEPNRIFGSLMEKRIQDLKAEYNIPQRKVIVDAELKDLYEGGFTYSDIASIYSCTSTTIRNCINKLVEDGVIEEKIDKRKISAMDIDRILLYYKMGYDTKAISELVNLSPYVIKIQIKENIKKGVIKDRVIYSEAMKDELIIKLYKYGFNTDFIAYEASESIRKVTLKISEFIESGILTHKPNHRGMVCSDYVKALYENGCSTQDIAGDYDIEVEYLESYIDRLVKQKLIRYKKAI